MEVLKGVSRRPNPQEAKLQTKEINKQSLNFILKKNL
jgi:hypothetical protein